MAVEGGYVSRKHLTILQNNCSIIIIGIHVRPEILVVILLSVVFDNPLLHSYHTGSNFRGVLIFVDFVGTSLTTKIYF